MISRHYFHIFYFIANVIFDKINDALVYFSIIYVSTVYWYQPNWNVRISARCCVAAIAQFPAFPDIFMAYF